MNGKCKFGDKDKCYLTSNSKVSYFNLKQTTIGNYQKW